MVSERTLETIRLVILLFDSIWRSTSIAIDKCAQSIRPKGFGVYFINLLDIFQHCLGTLIATQALVLLKWNNLRHGAIRFLSKKDKATGSCSFTVINKRMLHRNNPIYDLYINRALSGEVKIMEKEPCKETQVKVTKYMINKCWKEIMTRQILWHNNNCHEQEVLLETEAENWSWKGNRTRKLFQKIHIYILFLISIAIIILFLSKIIPHKVSYMNP